MIDIKRVIDLIDTGFNDKQISLNVGVTREYIRQIRKEHRPNVKSIYFRTKCSPLSEEKLGEIIKIATTQNMSCAKIGDMFKMSGYRIRAILIKYGVKKLPAKAATH